MIITKDQIKAHGLKEEEYKKIIGLLGREANLVALGIDGSRIRSHGVGEAYPIGDNSTNFGRLQNRRVEVYIRPINS